MQVFDFKNPRFMVPDGNGKLLRMEYDKINGYRGLTYNDAMKIFTNDIPIVKTNTYITCFCANMSITDDMKNEYGDIIIVTTKHRLLESIDKTIVGFKFNCFPVMYLEETDSNDLFFYQNAIYFDNLFGVKRTKYAAEEEFRLQFSREEIIPSAVNHILSKVDLDRLIVKIITTNQTAFDFVQSINKNAELSLNIELLQERT